MSPPTTFPPPLSDSFRPVAAPGAHPPSAPTSESSQSDAIIAMPADAAAPTACVAVAIPIPIASSPPTKPQNGHHSTTLEQNHKTSSPTKRKSHGRQALSPISNTAKNKKKPSSTKSCQRVTTSAFSSVAVPMLPDTLRDSPPCRRLFHLANPSRQLVLRLH
mmetsp:Transcript_7906/g.17806  ORF Transcript_7906/g.17806 Transcript_7906/m.17806 type:complete len:162 (+) Transcript_7906:112-597(+)